MEETGRRLSSPGHCQRVGPSLPSLFGPCTVYPLAAHLCTQALCMWKRDIRVHYVLLDCSKDSSLRKDSVSRAQPHCETLDRITRSPRAAAMNNALGETIAPHANVNKRRCWCSSNRLFLLLLILSAVFEICACGFTFNLFVSLYFVLAGPVISHD